MYAALLNIALNALRLESWFPILMSVPLPAKTCAIRPTQTIARFCGLSSLLCNRPAHLVFFIALCFGRCPGQSPPPFESRRE